LIDRELSCRDKELAEGVVASVAESAFQRLARTLAFVVQAYRFCFLGVFVIVFAGV
jgi:hypothetical protein